MTWNLHIPALDAQMPATGALEQVDLCSLLLCEYGSVEGCCNLHLTSMEHSTASDLAFTLYG